MHIATGDAPFSGTVTLCERLGEVCVVHVALADGTPLIAKLPGDAAVQRGDRLSLAVTPEKVHRFDAEGRTLGAGS